MAKHSVPCFERRITPDLVVATDEACCVVLCTPERTITVTNVDALKDALDLARTFAQIYDEDARQHAGSAD